ncbi:YcaO-like family protein [Halomicroarcula sp. GCM10025709]|uniref:YcaO-like family protein n=1 Tax=Haloarcula TaxID=2237 RepID=UPI0024C40857|nr:YcaO-like family protein [Halomicroarcula sp. YJ-61-S]
MTPVAVVGTGPATDALTAALSEAAITVEHQQDPESVDAEFVVAVDRAGADTFRTVDERARTDSQRWVAVELGGVGGAPVVDAAITGFGPESGCYDCLEARVAAAVDGPVDGVDRPDSGTQRYAGALAGHRIATALDGGERLSGTITEVPHAERTFLPVPGCACGPERDWELRRGADDADTDALTRAERGLDERVGIVTEVGEAESFPAPYYLSTLCDTSGFSDAAAPRQAAGVGADWDTAFMKALGESYERYAGGVYRTGTLPNRPPEDHVAPAAFVTPESHTSEPPVAWVPGEQLASGTAAALPAETVFYPPPSERVRPATTTGLGLGSSGTDALLAGLYEIVERDAAMLSWYSTYEPLAVRVGDHEGFETLRRRASAEGLSVTPLLLTQDIDVPVVAVAVEGETWPKFALGMAADLDPGQAAVGALAEALQNWMELRGMGRSQAQEADGAIGRYADRPRSVQSLTDTETAVPLGRLGPDRVGEPPAELATLVERVTAVGIEPYGVRLTQRDLDAMGFEAVRVVCPSAQPLVFGESYFGERARSVPEELGFEPRLDRAHHPFP